jgi:hypothetical protein
MPINTTNRDDLHPIPTFSSKLAIAIIMPINTTNSDYLPPIPTISSKLAIAITTAYQYNKEESLTGYSAIQRLVSHLQL